MENHSVKELNLDSMSTKSLAQSKLDGLNYHSNLGQSKGRKSNYANAENPDKIEQAKKILIACDYSLEELLMNSEFKGYDKTSDYRRYVKKFLLNHKSKKSQTKTSIDNDLTISDKDSIQSKRMNTDIEEVKMPHSHLQNDIRQQKGILKIDQGALLAYERLLTYYEGFKSSTTQQKSVIIQEITLRNTQSLYQFLDICRNQLDSSSNIDLFLILIDLINNNDQIDQDSKSRILLNSFTFYQGEVVQVPDKILFDACNLLIKQNNVHQAHGLANFLFINENQSFAIQEGMIQKLDISNPNIVHLMGLTFNTFDIDPQVKQLIPSSWHIFNIPFLSALKKNCGMNLIREIPQIYTPFFVRICALSRFSKSEELQDFITQVRAIFIQKLELLNEQSILFFLQGLSERLEARDTKWVGKIEQIKRLFLQLVEAQIEKGVNLDNQIIKNCLNGDFSQLERILHLPKAMEIFSDETIAELFRLFEQENSQIQSVVKFNESPQQRRLWVSSELEKLQQVLGFNHYCSQVMCINYILSSINENHLMHFGIGNGKTLICLTLAILIARMKNCPVFIIGKNEHLVQRDYIKFERVIQQMDLNSSMASYSKEKGIYFFTMVQLKKVMTQHKALQVWANSYVIVDEYDWILLDGSIEAIAKNLDLFSQAQTVLGFSGSTPSLTEQRCLKTALDCSPVIFPSLDKLKGDKKIQHSDMLITSNQADYIKALKDLIEEQIRYSPVLIVAQDSYRIIDQGLSQSNLDFQGLSKNAASVIESVIEGRYLMRNAKKLYGVYLLNEAHGRGTDIQTNDEIDSTGGSYLIIADVFSRRSEEQIIGRIGRLNTKGQWKRVIYRQGAKDSIEQLLYVEQNSLDLNLNTKYNKVSAKIQDLFEDQDMQDQSHEQEQKEKAEEKPQEGPPLLPEESQIQPQVAQEEPVAVQMVQPEQNNAPEEEEKKPVTKPEEIEEEKSNESSFQSSILEAITNKLSKHPVLANQPKEEIKERVKEIMKRQVNDVSNTPDRSRSKSKDSSGKRKRGRPRTKISDSSSIKDFYASQPK